MNEMPNAPSPCQYPPCSLILDTMAEGLLAVDGEGLIRVWNHAMEALTGYTAREVLGKPCTLLRCEAVPPYDTCGGDADSVRGILEGRVDAIERRDCLLRPREGAPIPVLRNARPMYDAEGRLVGVVETVTDQRPIKRLEQALSALRLPPNATAVGGLGRLIGKSKKMQDVYERVRLAADSAATVLIHGETGTGKELVAEAIHRNGERADGPFVKVNCSALSESLLESELFGHVKGAFTGAVRDKIGRFEAAAGGTILLDEIGDVSPLIQLKLLRVLQEKTFERVGEAHARRVDVRVLAATHRDLRRLVREGLFREDLYYRIRVFDIAVPPLRERREDIPMLVDAFVKRFNGETGKAIVGIDSDVMYCFMDYCWPGNVRELEHALEHAFVTCRAERITLFDLPLEIRMMDLRAATCRGTPDREPLEGAIATIGGPGALRHPRGASHGGLTRARLMAALEGAAWNKAEAARRLGVTRTTVWRKMKQWDVPFEPPQSRTP